MKNDNTNFINSPVLVSFDISDHDHPVATIAKCDSSDIQIINTLVGDKAMKLYNIIAANTEM